MPPASAESPSLRILIAESRGFSPEAMARLEALGNVECADLDQDGLAAAAAGAHVMFVRLRNRIDAAVVEAAPGLKAVVTPTTGLDHIDLAAADAAGVAVLSLKGETAFLETVTATAEHTWGLLLALVRRIPEAASATRRGEWDRDRFRGRELKGRTLGVLGLGRLGTMVARYGRAFGMEVVAYDPDRTHWPESVERAPSVEALAARSDVFSIHVPLDDSTAHLVEADVLHRLPRGAVLVNTARGEIVDETALLDALRSGHLAGAALDVLQGETSGDVAESPVLAYAAEHEHLLVTPHIGGATLESMENTEIFMAEKLAAWLVGEVVRVDAGPERRRLDAAGLEP